MNERSFNAVKDHEAFLLHKKGLRADHIKKQAHKRCLSNISSYNLQQAKELKDAMQNDYHESLRQERMILSNEKAQTFDLNFCATRDLKNF